MGYSMDQPEVLVELKTSLIPHYLTHFCISIGISSQFSRDLYKKGSKIRVKTGAIDGTVHINYSITSLRQQMLRFSIFT